MQRFSLTPRRLRLAAGTLAFVATCAAALASAGAIAAHPPFQPARPLPTSAAVLALPLVDQGPPATPKPPPLRADVVLLVHTSPTLAGARLDTVRAALATFAGRMAADRDQAALVSFDGEARVVVPLTRDGARLAEGIRTLGPGRGGRYDRGMRAAREVLLDLPDGRNRNWENRGVVVVLTDAPHEGSAADAIAEAFFTGNSGFTIFAVPLGPSPDRDLLRRMSDAQFDAPDEAALGGAFDALVHRLRAMP